MQVREIKEEGFMKRLVVSGLVAFLCVVVLAAAALAQQAGQRGMRGGGQRMYDPSKAEIVSGDVVAVKEFTSRNGMRKGVGLELNAAGRTIVVHLGPQFYLDKQAVKIAAGDKVEITGVKAMRRGGEMFIAGEVKKGGESLKLRDDTGMPLWAGSGPGCKRS